MRKFFSIFTTLFLFCNQAFATTDSSFKNRKLELSLSLAKDTLQQTEDNFIVSPFSLYIVADMLANGAKGETLQKLQQKILDKSTSLSLKDINEEITSTIKNLSSAIEINNAIWGNEFKPEYIEIIKSLPAEIFDLPEHTNFINTWVENKTHGLIKDLLEPQTISSEDNELFLVNTVYFKGKWDIPFDPQNTEQQEFNSLNQNSSANLVKMMYQEGDVKYYENNVFQALRLPYQNSDYIDIILPKEDVDFKEFINKLTVDDLNFSYTIEDVHIYLPRLETEYKVELNDYFKKLQIPVFIGDEKKDFSIMSKFPCHVSKIIHQANIQLDEEGTTASAATEVDMLEDGFSEMLIAEKPKIFNANRPFIYIINDGLFLGVYTQGKLF